MSKLLLPQYILSQQERRFVGYSYHRRNNEKFYPTANGCGKSLIPTLPPAAAARPLATATPPAPVTKDTARSRASTGAPQLPKDDAVAPLPGVGASVEPATLAGVDGSQPPPDPPANTAKTLSVHFKDSTDEEDAPMAGGGPEASDDPDDEDGDDDDDDDDNEEDDTDWTAIYVMEQQANLPEYVVTEADRRLDKVYGDHPHSNAGTHLSGGVDQDKLWQNRWLETMQLATTTYTVPKGRIGWRFCKYLTLLWQGVRHRKWNSERPLMYAKLILQTTPDVKTSSDVRARLEMRMEIWEKGRIRALLDDVIAEVGARKGRRGEGAILSGSRRLGPTPVCCSRGDEPRGVTNRAGGGVLQPDDVCTKTGRPVLEVLRGKHPKMREPDLDDPQSKIFEAYPLVPQAVTVEKVDSHLSGAAGPSGTDAVDLSNWLLRHGAESQLLQNEMAYFANWLANNHPPWAAYRALMACRLVTLDKQPGTRPVGIGEIWPLSPTFREMCP
jgi:hypothetical protein